MRGNRPLIVDVKRHALHDGPGIRTTVFFKGCPLNCFWCHNPEAISQEPEIAFYPQHCIGCFECEEVCSEGAILKELEVRIDRSKCTLCGKCVEVCPGKGIRKVGVYYEIDTLIEILLRDRVFYKTSGGGVTLSGGEPTLWPDYNGELLKKIKLEGIHTTVQTCGYFKYSTFKEKMLPWIDLVMYDIKIINPEDHYKHTGRNNQLILGNFLSLLKEDISVIPRIPLIPGFTTSKENLADISEFLKKNGDKKCSLLPYNTLGLSKWDYLGKIRPALPSSDLQ